MPNKTIYLSEEEQEKFKEIEDLARKEKRGVGYKIIEIFKEWKLFKADTMSAQDGSKKQ